MTLLNRLIGMINIDQILSDPLLLIGTILFILSFLAFFFGLIKWIASPRKSADAFTVPHGDVEEPIPSGEIPADETPAPAPIAIPIKEEPQQINPVVEDHPLPTPPISPSVKKEDRSDKTMVIAPGEAAIQGQLDIVITQIKNLNKKVSDLEDSFENTSNATKKAEAGELKEMPRDMGDFAQKLLKLAEHVIILEKEMARLKGKEPGPRANPDATIIMAPKPATPGSATPGSPALGAVNPKPPVMPL